MDRNGLLVELHLTTGRRTDEYLTWCARAQAHDRVHPNISLQRNHGEGTMNVPTHNTN
jgi:hypothetical protein